MRVMKFFIEESKVNKGMMILIAITADDKKFVVGGQHDNPTALIPYERCWDAIGKEKFNELHGLK